MQITWLIAVTQLGAIEVGAAMVILWLDFSVIPVIDR